MFSSGWWLLFVTEVCEVLFFMIFVCRKDSEISAYVFPEGKLGFGYKPKGVKIYLKWGLEVKFNFTFFVLEVPV